MLLEGLSWVGFIEGHMSLARRRANGRNAAGAVDGGLRVRGHDRRREWNVQLTVLGGHSDLGAHFAVAHPE